METLENIVVKLRHPVSLFVALLILISLITISLYLFVHSFNHFIFENALSTTFLRTLTNPIFAIFVGAISSAIVRSSSIVITLLAAMVSAGYPFVDAIYILLGANIGTTFHGSLLHKLPDCDIYDKQRMTAISSMHYFNNIIAFSIFFPLQISTNFLGYISQLIVGWIMSVKEWFGLPIDATILHTPALIKIIQENLEMSFYPIISLIILFLLISLLMRLFFVVLRLLFDAFVIRRLDVLMKTKKLEQWIILWGIFFSSLLQSSSSTLYVLMPLVRKVSCASRSFYPLILGINVGTCFTTIFFSFLLQSKLGLAIGFAHLLYNIFSLIILNYVPLLRELPILASSQLAFCSYECRPQDKESK